jgi:site-specific recombinase XerD
MLWIEINTMQQTHHTKTFNYKIFSESSGGRIEAWRRFAHIIQTYCSFFTFLEETNLAATGPTNVTKADISEYLANLSQQGVSGVSRARKLAAIREFFRFLEGHGVIAKSPAATITTPKKERNGRTWLLPEEYNRMLSLAGADPRDYAILQVFLQTGIRVSELCSLRLSDIDVSGRTLTVTAGKGMAAHTIEFEPKGIKAITDLSRKL